MPPRKNIHLQRGFYTGRRLFFVTICCDHKRPLFSNAKLAAWIEKRLLASASSYHFRLHAWCVMPDHVHFLAEGMDDACDLRGFIRRFKFKSSVEWKVRSNLPLWQRNFYEHILRRLEELSGIAAYIWSNPVRKELCRDPRKYPFSGSETLDWKKIVPLENPWRPPWSED